MKRVLSLLIRLYQSISGSFLPKTCRFHPSCSEYGYQAIQRYGAFRGTWMLICRLLKCHPFHKGGFDPVR